MNAPLVLLTGFGPFGDVTENPSGALAQQLAAHPPEGLRVTAALLPVTFAGVPAALAAFVESAQRGRAPAALLSMGVHPGEGFRLERCARKAPDSTSADNDGQLASAFHVARPRECTLDLEPLVTLLQPLAVEAGSHVRISDDAGGYVCDWTYVHLLEHAERLGIPALFLHVPPIERTALELQRPLVERLVRWLARQAG